MSRSFAKLNLSLYRSRRMIHECIDQTSNYIWAHINIQIVDSNRL